MLIFIKKRVHKYFNKGINTAEFCFYEMYTGWNFNKFAMLSWSHQNKIWFKHNLILTCKKTHQLLLCINTYLIQGPYLQKKIVQLDVNLKL